MEVLEKEKLIVRDLYKNFDGSHALRCVAAFLFYSIFTQSTLNVFYALFQ